MASELGAGLGDILSMALEQTGVEALQPPQISMDSHSILSAAADTLDSSLLSSDIGVLTEGLFSTLAMVKETPIPLVANNLTAPVVTTQSEVPLESTPPAIVQETIAQEAPVPVEAVPMSTEASVLSKPSPVMGGESLDLHQPVAKGEAEGVKTEVQSSMLDDDIDLNEFLSVGDDIDANINHLSLLGMDIAPPVSASESSLQSTTGPLPPPLPESDTGTNNDATSSIDDLSSLLSITGSQYLESLDPSFIADNSGKNETNKTKPAVNDVKLSPLSSVSTPILSPQPVIADLVNSVTTASDSLSTTNVPPLPPIAATSLISTATVSSSPLTTALLPLSTSASVTSSVPMTSTTTTKLDVAAILNKVTQQVTSSTAASTTLTNSVSVTVVPSPNALKGISQKKPTIIPLHGGLPIVTRTPLALKSER